MELNIWVGAWSIFTVYKPLFGLYPIWSNLLKVYCRSYLSNGASVHHQKYQSPYFDGTQLLRMLESPDQDQIQDGFDTVSDVGDSTYV